MKKLKTLKDIEYIAEEKYGYAVDVDAEVLRSAACEQIKEWESKIKEQRKLEHKLAIEESSEITSLRDRIKAFRRFFNLEDEK